MASPSPYLSTQPPSLLLVPRCMSMSDTSSPQMGEKVISAVRPGQAFSLWAAQTMDTEKRRKGEIEGAVMNFARIPRRKPTHRPADCPSRLRRKGVNATNNGMWFLMESQNGGMPTAKNRTSCAECRGFRCLRSVAFGGPAWIRERGPMDRIYPPT